jgi:glycosyltransferase involved in cell wall biosynthesis
MNILYIWDADYPWDIRVEKICVSLKERGHTVHIASRNLSKKPVYEIIDGLHIHRLQPFRNDKLNYYLSFPCFFSPVWKSFIDGILISHRIDCIVVRDLPMVIAGIWAGRRHRIKVIFDMAENYVALVRDIWNEKKFKGFNLIVRNPYFARMVEWYALKRVDFTIVVVDEALGVFQRGGGDPRKVAVVGNTPDIRVVKDHTKIQNDILRKMGKKFTAIYVGGIQKGRGIQTVIESIPIISKIIPEFLFAVVGTGYAEQWLKMKSSAVGSDKYIEWVGWVNHNEMFNYLSASKIGIIPHLVTEHVATTIPNKIFDYMSMKLPVIASNAPPLERIIREERCGITFESGNATDLARAVKEVYSATTDYGANGWKTVREKYNWSEDEQRLIKILNHIHR